MPAAWMYPGGPDRESATNRSTAAAVGVQVGVSLAALQRAHGFRAHASARIGAGAIAVACSRLDLGALATAAPIRVAAALAFNCVSMMLRSLVWLGTLRGAFPGVAVPVGGVVRATMIGVLASAVAPGRVGEGVRA